MSIIWIDSHAHPHFEEDGGIAALESAKQDNIEKVLCVATELAQHAQLKNLYEKYPQHVMYSLGIHPLDENLASSDWDLFEKLVAEDLQIIALGETGFDINGDYNQQYSAYETHAYLAKKFGVPIIMHTRDSDEQAIEMIKKYPDVRGVLHCFTGSLELAKVAADFSWKVSFSGIITFKKADEIRTVARALPLDAILIETDAPYLAPEPMRGKSNRTEWVRYVGQYMSHMLNIETEVFAHEIRKNFFDLFKERNKKE